MNVNLWLEFAFCESFEWLLISYVVEPFDFAKSKINQAS